MKRKGGQWRSTRYGYRFCKDCSKEYVPIKVWAAANFFTVKQCQRLLRRGDLVGMRVKGRMMVAPTRDNISRDEC